MNENLNSIQIYFQIYKASHQMNQLQNSNLSSQFSNQTALMCSVIKCEPKNSRQDISKSPLPQDDENLTKSKNSQNSQQRYEHFKQQLSHLHDQHRRSMEILKERSRPSNAGVGRGASTQRSGSGSANHADGSTPRGSARPTKEHGLNQLKDKSSASSNKQNFNDEASSRLQQSDMQTVQRFKPRQASPSSRGISQLQDGSVICHRGTVQAAQQRSLDQDRSQFRAPTCDQENNRSIQRTSSMMHAPSTPGHPDCPGLNAMPAAIATPTNDDKGSKMLLSDLYHQQNQELQKSQISDNTSNKTNLTAIMKSHVIDEDRSQLVSDERRMRQIIQIQYMNQSRLEQLKKSNLYKRHEGSDLRLTTAAEEQMQKEMQEYMTFSRLQLQQSKESRGKINESIDSHQHNELNLNITESQFPTYDVAGQQRDHPKNSAQNIGERIDQNVLDSSKQNTLDFPHFQYDHDQGNGAISTEDQNAIAQQQMLEYLRTEEAQKLVNDHQMMNQMQQHDREHQVNPLRLDLNLLNRNTSNDLNQNEEIADQVDRMHAIADKDHSYDQIHPQLHPHFMDEQENKDDEFLAQVEKADQSAKIENGGQRNDNSLEESPAVDCKYFQQAQTTVQDSKEQHCKIDLSSPIKFNKKELIEHQIKAQFEQRQEIQYTSNFGREYQKSVSSRSRSGSAYDNSISPRPCSQGRSNYRSVGNQPSTSQTTTNRKLKAPTRFNQIDKSTLPLQVDREPHLVVGNESTARTGAETATNMVSVQTNQATQRVSQGKDQQAAHLRNKSSLVSKCSSINQPFGIKDPSSVQFDLNGESLNLTEQDDSQNNFKQGDDAARGGEDQSSQQWRSNYIFTDVPSFLELYPPPASVNGPSSAALSDPEYVKWNVRFELYQQLKAQFDNEIQTFMRQFRHDQIELMKREFHDEFKQTLEAERQALEDQFTQRERQMEEECLNKYEQARQEMEKQVEEAYQEQVRVLTQEYDQKLQSQKTSIKTECLQTYRNEKEDQICQRLRLKLEKQIRQELEVKLRREIEAEILSQGEVEQKIRMKIETEYDKQLAQAKRKFKLELQEKENEMQENFQQNFEYEVRKKSVALLEKRELDIQRKYRVQFQKQQAKFEKEMKEKCDNEMHETKARLQAEIAELSRLKSAEQVRIKKQAEQQRQLIEQLNQQKNELMHQQKFQEYLNREKQVNMGLMQQKLENVIQQEESKRTQQLNKFSQNQRAKPSSRSRSRSRSNPRERPQPDNHSSRNRSRSNMSKKSQNQNLKNDFGALHIFKNKNQKKLQNFLQTEVDDDLKEDEYTLGQVREDKREHIQQQLLGGQYGSIDEEEQSASPEPNPQLQVDQLAVKKDQNKPAFLLDSQYERDFDQKFLMNKLNFEQVNKALDLSEAQIEDDKNQNHGSNDFRNQNTTESDSANVSNHKYQQSNIQIDLDENNPFMRNLANLQSQETVHQNRKEDFDSKQQNHQSQSKNTALLTTKDREFLTESIRNLKYEPQKNQKLTNDKNESNQMTGCISIKDQVLRQLQRARQSREVAQDGDQSIAATGMRESSRQRGGSKQDGPDQEENLELSDNERSRISGYGTCAQIQPTELHCFKENIGNYKQNIQQFQDKIEQFIKNDKTSEVMFKSTFKDLKNEILEAISNDHGLIDYLNDLHQKLHVPFRSRSTYFQNIQNYIQYQKSNQKTISDRKLPLILYQKLQDEIDRLNEYQLKTSEIFGLIRKREEVSQYDQKYRNTLASQICIKIEEYRRQIRKVKIMQKGQKAGPSSAELIEDIYWKGLSYHDVCKAERELKEIKDKEKIKQDIQQRKMKLQQQSQCNSALSLGPGLPLGGGGLASRRGRGVGLGGQVQQNRQGGTLPDKNSCNGSIAPTTQSKPPQASNVAQRAILISSRRSTSRNALRKNNSQQKLEKQCDTNGSEHFSMPKRLAFGRKNSAQLIGTGSHSKAAMPERIGPGHESARLDQSTISQSSAYQQALMKLGAGRNEASCYNMK